MKLRVSLCKKIFSFFLAASVLTANALPGQMSVTVKAAAESETGETAEEVTLQSVRDEAKAAYEADKLGMDLDLSNQSFSGAGGLDYSSDTAERAYMQVFNNLRDHSTQQTIVFRFKTTVASQFIFGTGVDGSNNGKNMTFSLKDGAIRFRLRNSNRQQGGTKAGLQGNLGSNLNDGKYHTVAISLCPDLGYAAGNVRFVIDGGSDIYPAAWCPEWKAGFDQNEEDFTKFHIGSSALYGGDGDNAAFNGSIDFITVINKGYSVQELQKITQGDKVYTDFTEMWEGGTCRTWLFTGGTEGVADFATSRTTRNWVGLYETDMRESGSFIVRGRFVFNTAKRGADVAQIVKEYDTRVTPFGTSVVGIMIGAADYQKGEEGIPEFKENLQAFLDKVVKESKKPLILTPYTAVSEKDQQNVLRYTEAIYEVVGDRFKVVDISDLGEENVNADGSLKPSGHQTIATKLQRETGAPVGRTNTLDKYADGCYTVAKQTESGEEAEVGEVIAEEDSIMVSIDADSEKEVHLEYTLTANGEVISETVPEGETEFTITGLKKGETYTLNVYDISRNNVKESYRPVEITVAAGAVGESHEYEDGNISVNDKIQKLLSGDKPVTYLFMGDSITHGVITDGYDNVPQMFAKYLDEIGRTDDIVLNTGVTNATIATTLDQIEPRLERFHPDVVMIMLGTNDTSVNGENTVTGFGTASKHGITVEQYAERYKELIRKVHETNSDASIVLRVPCDMAGQLDAHSGFEEKFAEIKNIAADMQEEISGLNIAVVDHLQGWRDYKNTVRNDNIAISGTYSWLANRNNDGIHPNGRGNLAMFQQIIKELGLYVPASELANYQYELSEWTDTSEIEAPVVMRGSRASFEIEALSGYANGLQNVTLTLTADGRSISKTAQYDAEGVITISGLDAQKTYTAAVAGKDADNSKEVSFAADISKDADTTATETEKAEYTNSLAAAKEMDMSAYPAEIRNAYKTALEEIEKEYSGEMTLDQIDAALTAIRMAQVNVQKALEEREEAAENLRKALEQTKTVHDEGMKDTYIEANWTAYDKAYQDAAGVNDNTGIEQLRTFLTNLQNAEEKLLSEKRQQNTELKDPVELKLEQGHVYPVGDYSYRIVSLSAHTAEVVGVLNNALNKVQIKSQVPIGKETFTVISVAAAAFSGNKVITEAVIENNVETIDDSAFAKCINLKKVNINSANLKKIGKKAFFGCKKLKVISIKGKGLKTVGKKAFKGTHAKLKITVPKAKYKAYVKKLAKKGQGKKAVINKK